MALGWRKEYLRYKGFFLNIFESYKKRKDVLIFIELLLSITTLIIFSIFALKPTTITITELIKQIKSKEELISKMDAKLADLKSAQTNYSNETARIQLLDTAVPTKPAPEAFLRQVQGATFNNLVDMESASIDEVALLGGVKKTQKGKEELLPSGADGISFYFDFKANFASLKTLLMDLENLRRPIKIETLKIAKQKSEEATSDILEFSMSGQAPYIR